ncbi:hypothetical protein TU12-16_00020 [Vibrio phage ICP2_2006_A]|uniref:Uncharacterized protein n=1 Tax=Vibrio phage ICP2_2006_A TaxID=979534 RepID=F1D0W4_9CAUD|nr:hypothetical protein TU12-16_00020 [Vibrio phage ICP2_2006_A]
MATNIFDTSNSIQAVASNQTPIQAGIQDDTPARVVQAVGSLGHKIGGDVVSQSVVNDARNILDNPQDIEIPTEIQPYLDRMGGLADKVKAGMQRREAQVKARAIMAEAINQYPFFAKEIRERGATLFGIGSSSSSLGKVDMELSPEEKALNDYREKVTQTQLEFGVSQQTAMNLIQSQRQSEIRKLNAENFTDDIYVGVNDATIRAQDEIFRTMFNSPTGTLGLEQQRALEIGIERSAVQLQKTLMQSATNRGAITKDTFETIDLQVKQFKQNMKTLISDQTAMKWVKAQNDLAAEMITAWGNQNYGGLTYLAKNNAIPDSMKESIFRSMAGDERAKALIKNNPFLSDLMTKSQNLGYSLQRAYGAVTNEMVGITANPEQEKEIEKVGETEKVVSTTLALNNKQGGAIYNLDMIRNNSATAQPVIDRALRAAPENITRWLTTQYKAAFDKDRDLMKTTIDHELDVVTSSLRGRIVSTMGTNGSFDDITISVKTEKAPSYPIMMSATPKTTVTINGIEDQYVKSRLIDTYNVIKENPDIWKNFASSPEEYLELLIKRPIDWKQPLEVKRQKADALENAPERGGAPKRTMMLSKEEEKAFEEFKQQGITPDALKTIYAGLRYKDPQTGKVDEGAPELMDPSNLLGKYEQYYRG